MKHVAFLLLAACSSDPSSRPTAWHARLDKEPCVPACPSSHACDLSSNICMPLPCGHSCAMNERCVRLVVTTFGLTEYHCVDMRKSNGTVHMDGTVTFDGQGDNSDKFGGR